ncbi:E3 ubiquitin-protein ligase LRSAM1-like [Macrosteles quadrilineatus]|uniref:E3 ubiquitin-protein ligase LRSAM1-like n=1 Tax=Macrosteles quadrilineatus TaxID=74068 RepID=UPI0023E2D680|nr:E3 ubiquitin-protein ligase LRSAM1-like [Macrosteles quadrilineatus]
MTMNLFGKKSSQSETNYKSRLERKLYLARENPEPVFDLSECNLKTVPPGVYSLCKVFRKEVLLLQVNQLSSLLGGGLLSDLHLLNHLDLHKNRLTSLPQDIIHLTNLQVLNVSYNDLKKLPKAIGCLQNLQLLDCSHNKLESVPSSLVELRNLTTLDLRDNPHLTSLPPTLHPPHLLVDPSVSTQHCDTEGSSNIEGYDAELSKTEEEGKRFQEERQKDLLDIERSLMAQKDEEFKRHESIKQNKDKLILDLKQQQKKLGQDVSRFQSQKEEERSKLLNYLLQVERQTDERVQDLISMSQVLRRSSQWQEQDMRERELLEEYKRRNHQLRHQEVIDAMEFLLAEECAQRNKLLEYEKNKVEIIQNSLLREEEWREQVGWMLGVRDAQQSAVVAAVETDTEIQKALVATLLERSDLRSSSLVMQVALIQQQLAVLTDVELQRRKVDSVHHVNDLAEKRKALSELLVEILREQQERRKQLTNQLQELETDRELSGRSTDYWLRQYQRLLDVRPPQLRGSLDPNLVYEVVRAGAAHCLPFLACCNIHTLSATQLSQVGVTSVEDQTAVLSAVSSYLQQVSPSAPPAMTDPYKPSAPPVECVVCMEAKCNIVFVPCGHLCTCASCASNLLLCPLCRSSLQRKIQVYI